MCGIQGAFFSRPATPEDYTAFSAALETMFTRGPDDGGITALFTREMRAVSTENEAEGADALLGHRRLSILDLSPAGHQPMASGDQRVHVVFNGEIFNYIELRDRLKAEGRTFQTQTDTEVVLQAYQAWGTNCFRAFNGMWGIALLDLNAGKLILSRDHFGIKPLYYTQNESGLFFASSIKSVLQASRIRRVAENKAVFSFINCEQLPADPMTFFKNVCALPAAHYAEFSLADITKKPAPVCWWRIGDRPTPNAGQTDKTFQDLFEDAVRIRLRSDVPVGGCLSGGLDSSAITVSMAHQLNGARQLKTVTCYFEGEAYDERPYAEAVIRATNADAVLFNPADNPSFSADLNALIQIQEEPFQTLSIYNQYCVMREAKKAGLTVMLDGQGADELMLGYYPSLRDYMQKLGEAGNLRGMWRMTRRDKNGPPWRYYRLFFKTFRRLIKYKIMRFFGREKPLRPIWLTPHIKPEFAAMLGPGVRENVYDKLGPVQWRERMTQDFSLAGLLRFEDRNSMAFSIETRLPFLDYRLADFLFNTDPVHFTRGGWTKSLLRDYLNRDGLQEVAYRRKKIGFAAPTATLMAEHPECFAALKESPWRSEPFLDTAHYQDAIARNQYTDKDWYGICLELWMRAFQVEFEPES